jgi:hypothetical protein
MNEQQCRQRAGSVSDRSRKALALRERAAFSASRDAGKAGEGSAARGLAVISSPVPTLRRRRPHPPLRGTFSRREKGSKNRRKSRNTIGTYVDACCVQTSGGACNSAPFARTAYLELKVRANQSTLHALLIATELRFRRKSRKRSCTYVDFRTPSEPVLFIRRRSRAKYGPRRLPTVARSAKLLDLRNV